ncbi:hypothetical protein ABK040_001562 [Willaertia magna]
MTSNNPERSLDQTNIPLFIHHVLTFAFCFSIIIYLFPSIKDQLLQLFHSFLLSFEKIIQELVTLTSSLEEDYQNHKKNNNFNELLKSEEKHDTISFTNANLNGSLVTKEQPTTSDKSIQVNREKVLRFDISTQIQDLDFETYEMRSNRDGPFGKYKPYRSIRTDFDTRYIVDETTNDKYVVPGPYEFVNGINKSTKPRVYTEQSSSQSNKKKKQQLINHQIHSKSLFMDEDDRLNDIQTPKRKKKFEDSSVDYYTGSSGSQWKRVSINYLKSENNLDYENTTDSINYSDEDEENENQEDKPIVVGNQQENEEIEEQSNENDDGSNSPSLDELTETTAVVNNKEEEKDDAPKLNINNPLKVPFLQAFDETRESIDASPITISEMRRKLDGRRITSGEYRQLRFESQSLDETINVLKSLKQIFDNVVSRDQKFSKVHHPIHITTKVHNLFFKYNILTQLPVQSFVDAGNITTLDISNNYISSVPAWFSTTLKNLTNLNISQNFLFDLPENFVELKRLKELDLSNNCFEYIPQCILKLPISTLDVSHNSLLLLPNDISLLKNSLTELNISYNELREVPDDIRHLKRLKYLKYVDNEIFYYSISLVLSKLNVEEVKPKMKTRRRSMKMPSLFVSSSENANATLIDEGDIELKSIDTEFQSYLPTRLILILQLMNSESEYLSHMNVLQEILYTPMLEIYRSKTEFTITTSEKESILPTVILPLITHVRDLFMELKSNVTPLLQYTNKFPEDTISISKVFLERISEFRDFYVKYPCVYENALAILTKLRKTNQDFEKYLNGRRKLPICNGLLYDSFLLLPVSRLSIYVKFLQKILRYTSEKHPDFKSLRTTVKEMKNILSLQEQYSFLINNKYKILDVERKLRMSESLLVPGRFFIREGRLTVAQNRGITNFKKDVMNKLYNKGNITENIKDLSPYWENFKNKKFEDLLEVRFKEFQVYVYLLSDVVIIKETNFVQKLVARSNTYSLEGATVSLGDNPKKEKEESETELIDGSSSNNNNNTVSPRREVITSPTEVVNAEKILSQALENSTDEDKDRLFTLTINTPTKRIVFGFICETKDELLEWYRDFDRAITQMNSKKKSSPTLIDQQMSMSKHEIITDENVSESSTTPELSLSNSLSSSRIEEKSEKRFLGLF